jgi:folylpolyglutamate synthase/dihydropteroate synthase
LEPLKAVTALSLPTNNIQNLIDKLSTLSVMSLGPVITSTGLAKNEVVGAEELTERASTDSIHSAWLQIDEYGTRNILVTGSLRHVSDGFVVVDSMRTSLK